MEKNSNLKKETITSVTTVDVERRMVVLRNQPVLIDADVAELYGVETRRVNEAVRNNPRKFPYGYIFELDKYEKSEVVENFDHLKKLKFSSVSPTAFTERGLYMLATILKSKSALNVTFAIIETFTKVRNLKRELVELHKETDPQVQSSKMHDFGKMLSDIVMPDLETLETESTLELNFFIGKIKHTVKRVKRSKEE